MRPFQALGLVAASVALSAVTTVVAVPPFSSGSYPFILLDDMDDDAYVGNVTVGSPPQPIGVQVDFMSADFWVPGNDTGLGRPHRVFQHELSATYRYDGSNMTLPYSPRINASVIVEVSDDKLGLDAGLSINVTFGLAVHLDSYFWAAQFDGILGLGLDDLTRVSRRTVVDELVHQRNFAPLFSLYLANGQAAKDVTTKAAKNGASAVESAPSNNDNSVTGVSSNDEAALSNKPALTAPNMGQSILLLGGYDMRYALHPAAPPLWLPVLPAMAPGVGSASTSSFLSASSDSGPLPSGTKSGDSGPGAGSGGPPLSTGYDLWRLALPHVTMDCGALKGAVGRMGLSGLSNFINVGEDQVGPGATAASRSSTRTRTPHPTPSSSSSAAPPRLSMGCVGSLAYVEWATQAVSKMGPPPPAFPSAVTAEKDESAAPVASTDAAEFTAASEDDSDDETVGAFSLDVCATDPAAAPGGGSSQCSGILTPSSRLIAVPKATLPLLVASVNVSCGGSCIVLPYRGLGLLCPVGKCGDKPEGSSRRRKDGNSGSQEENVWSAAAPVVVPAALPNLTFTFQQADEDDVSAGRRSSGSSSGQSGSGGSSGVRSLASVLSRLFSSSSDVSSGGDDDDGSGQLWDVTLLPQDYTQLLTPQEVKQALQKAAELLTKAHPTQDVATALLELEQLSAPNAYWRILLQPFGFGPHGWGASDRSSIRHGISSSDAIGSEGRSAVGSTVAGEGAANSPAPHPPPPSWPSGNSFAGSWVLGKPFLQAFYSIYDASGYQVGLAPTVPGRGPVPSRYSGGDDGWSGFWGSARMWIAVMVVFAGGIMGVACFGLARKRRRARRAAEFEREYHEKLLLGIPISSDGGGGGSHGPYSELLGQDGDTDDGGASAFVGNSVGGTPYAGYGYSYGGGGVPGDSSYAARDTADSGVHSGDASAYAYDVDQGSGGGMDGAAAGPYNRNGGGGGASPYYFVDAHGSRVRGSSIYEASASSSRGGGADLNGSLLGGSANSSINVIRPTVTPVAIAVPLSRGGTAAGATAAVVGPSSVSRTSAGGGGGGGSNTPSLGGGNTPSRGAYSPGFGPLSSDPSSYFNNAVNFALPPPPTSSSSSSSAAAAAAAGTGLGMSLPVRRLLFQQGQVQAQQQLQQQQLPRLRPPTSGSAIGSGQSVGLSRTPGSAIRPSPLAQLAMASDYSASAASGAAQRSLQQHQQRGAALPTSPSAVLVDADVDDPTLTADTPIPAPVPSSPLLGSRAISSSTTSSSGSR